MKTIIKVQMISGYRTEYFASMDAFLSKFFSVFHQYKWKDKTIRFDEYDKTLFSVDDCDFYYSEEKLYE